MRGTHEGDVKSLLRPWCTGGQFFEIEALKRENADMTSRYEREIKRADEMLRLAQRAAPVVQAREAPAPSAKSAPFMRVPWLPVLIASMALIAAAGGLAAFLLTRPGPAPEVVDVTPTSASVGQQVRVIGSNLDQVSAVFLRPVQGTIEGIHLPVTLVSSSLLLATIDSVVNPGDYILKVEAQNGDIIYEVPFLVGRASSSVR